MRAPAPPAATRTGPRGRADTRPRRVSVAAPPAAAGKRGSLFDVAALPASSGSAGGSPRSDNDDGSPRFYPRHSVSSQHQTPDRRRSSAAGSSAAGTPRSYAASERSGAGGVDPRTGRRRSTLTGDRRPSLSRPLPRGRASLVHEPNPDIGCSAVTKASVPDSRHLPGRKGERQQFTVPSRRSLPMAVYTEPPPERRRRSRPPPSEPEEDPRVDAAVQTDPEGAYAYLSPSVDALHDCGVEEAEARRRLAAEEGAARLAPAAARGAHVAAVACLAALRGDLVASEGAAREFLAATRDHGWEVVQMQRAHAAAGLAAAAARAPLLRQLAEEDDAVASHRDALAARGLPDGLSPRGAGPD